MTPFPLAEGRTTPSDYCERYQDKLPVTDRTICSYIDAALLDARNIDLRSKLRRPDRKKNGPILLAHRKCYMGRTYETYQAYMAQNPYALVSQINSVVILKGGQLILIDRGRSEFTVPQKVETDLKQENSSARYFTVP